MSIAVLKKKANTKYSKNISVGKDGFSINGTIRLKGVVGQTNLAVSCTYKTHVLKIEFQKIKKR